VVNPEKSSENAKPSRGGHRWVLHSPSLQPTITEGVDASDVRSPAEANYLTYDLPRKRAHLTNVIGKFS